MHPNEISREIISAALRVHTALGPGLLEKAYQRCLAYEIATTGLSVRTEVPLPVVYKQIRMNFGYRLDVVVNNLVVVEIKAIEALAPVHKAQLLSYLRMSGKPLGLLINFNVIHLRDGIKRVVNHLEDSTEEIPSRSSAAFASSAFRNSEEVNK